jgi:ribosomal protein S18 acetylase RimI-like enzyme
MTVTVRRAALSDAPGIAHVHVEAWREAYAGRIPDEFLASLDVDRRSRMWTALLTKGQTDAFVAERDGAVVGWATAGAGRDVDAPVDCELEGLYVLSEVYGSGVGQQLLDAAIGDAAAYLWVMDGNGRAEAFYRRNRFARDGTTKHETIGGAALPVIRMTR